MVDEKGSIIDAVYYNNMKAELREHAGPKGGPIQQNSKQSDATRTNSRLSGGASHTREMNKLEKRHWDAQRVGDGGIHHAAKFVSGWPG